MTYVFKHALGFWGIVDGHEYNDIDNVDGSRRSPQRT